MIDFKGSQTFTIPEGNILGAFREKDILEGHDFSFVYVPCFPTTADISVNI